MAITSNQFMT